MASRTCSSHGVFSESDASIYSAEILTGLCFLHAAGVIYRDLKLENVMLDRKGHIRLVDFGLAKDRMGHGEFTRTICGTASYLAPEIVMQSNYTKAIDFWALGVLLYALLVRENPFHSKVSASMHPLRRCRCTALIRFQ